MSEPAPPSPRPDAGRVVAIAIGGALGTLARYGVNQLGAGGALAFPWPTLAVNVAGSLVLGFVVTLLVERWPPTRYARPFAAIGFCGGFTTFSTLVVETARLGQHGRLALAALSLFGSMAAGLCAAAVGIGAARGSLLPRGRRSIPDPDDIALLREEPPAAPALVRKEPAGQAPELDPAGPPGRGSVRP